MREINADQVKDWAGARATDSAMETVARAVTGFVNSLPVVADRPKGEDWPEPVVLGARMLAARLYARRNSASGIEAFADAGATYISRWDSDIARLLQVDTFQRPAVA